MDVVLANVADPGEDLMNMPQREQGSHQELGRFAGQWCDPLHKQELVHAEGGPAPEAILPEGGAELAALFSGYFAARAGLPPP